MEVTVKKEITEQIKSIKLQSFFLLNKYINTEINLEELKYEFISIPFEYLSIEKIRDINNNIFIKYNFNLDIYQRVFDESFRRLLKIDNLNSKKIIFKDEDYGEDGVSFEDIIIEQLWCNTFDFIIFPESNKLKVKYIFELKDNIKDIRKDVNISQPIIIRQTVSNGKYYDIILILKQGSKIYAIFVQIGLNKKGSQINTYLKNFLFYRDKYKKGIETLIDNQIDSLGFMLIFDYEHQKVLQESHNETDGFNFCICNNIDFLIYQNFKFFKNLNDKQPIKSIQVTDTTLILKEKEENNISKIDFIKNKFAEICKDISLSEKLSPKIPLLEDEKALILDFMKHNFKTDYNMLNFAFNITENFRGFRDFGIIDFDNFSQINIFINKNSKFFCYNNEIFKISMGKIEKIEENRINSSKAKYNWDLYFLKRKRKFN